MRPAVRSSQLRGKDQLGARLLNLPQDRTTRILLVVVIVMGAAILTGTAVLIVTLIDLASQLGSAAGAPTLPVVGWHA